MTIPSPETIERPSNLSTAYFARAARKHALLVLACWVGVMACGIFATLGQVRIYRSEALLRFEPDPPRPLGQRVEIVSSPAINAWNRREFYETEFRILRSLRVAMSAVRSLGLQNDPTFLEFKSKDKSQASLYSVEDAARILVGRLTIEPVKESSLAYLRVDDTDPQRAQRILDAVIRAYMASNTERESFVSSSALEWLNGQVETLKGDLEKSEGALNDFRQKNNILSISLEDRHNILTSQLEQIAKELTTLEVRRAELAARKAELGGVKDDASNDLGVREFLQSTLLTTLRASLSEQRRNLEEALAAYGEGHPKILALKAKIAATESSIRAEISFIKNAATKDLRAVERQIGDLKKREEEIQKQAHELQTFEVHYNRLVRAKTYNEKIYGLVLERARETDLTTRMQTYNSVRVVDEPNVPRKPIKPNVPFNIGVAAVLGLLLGLAAGVGRELMDRSIRTPADVEEEVGITCIGLLPEIEADRRLQSAAKNTNVSPALRDRDLIVAREPNSGIAEAARVLRTNLTFMSPDRPYSAIVITSAVPQEGKTTVSCSLGIALAQSGFKVLLVDTDLRRPRLHRVFNMPNDVGVSLVVAGQATLEESIRETEIKNLSVLTAGPIPPNPAELLESERFRQLVDSIRARFDRVLFDSPPILPVTDAAILSRLVDGTLVVARGFHTPKSAVRQAIRRLADVKANILGIVLNAIDVGKDEYRDYHYYYKSGGYYRETDSPENG